MGRQCVEGAEGIDGGREGGAGMRGAGSQEGEGPELPVPTCARGFGAVCDVLTDTMGPVVVGMSPRGLFVGCSRGVQVQMRKWGKNIPDVLRKPHDLGSLGAAFERD
jgi:hypothetical protein